MLLNQHLYSNSFTTRKFTDIFPTVEEFLSEYESSGLPTTITDDSATILYYLLYSKYGNSHIASSDEYRFKTRVFSIIWQYGPTWEKEVEIQKAIRETPLEDVIAGAKIIYNQSYNPSTAPSTSSLEELTTINTQNTTNYKKSAMEGYSIILSLLADDVSERFLYRFKDLFRVVAYGAGLLYESED